MKILGIDVAKAKVDVALYDDKQYLTAGQFDNSPAGFKKLGKWLSHQTTEPIWACMEATGRYGEALATWLYQAGHSVSVVNPARIKKYAESQLKRNKTDQLDARLIADFCRTQEPRLWQPPTPEKRELQEMVRRWQGLISERSRERNRLQAGVVSEVVKSSITANLDFLTTQISQLEGQIQDHIDHHPDLNRELELLTSIKGIGPKTAFKIMGELPETDHFDHSGQVVAYAGLSPQQYTSGSSIHKPTQLTRMGNQTLKTALYFPAMTAIRFNPIIKALAARLTGRGKEKMVIIGAAMRKLLQLAYGVLKSGQPFDPDYVANSQATP